MRWFSDGSGQADFVRRFVGLIDRMKLFTDAPAFEQTLATCVRLAQVA